MSPTLKVYKNPAVAVDVIAFAVVDGQLKVLLIQRKHPPFRGAWAIPGGFVEYDEPLEDAARRELKEETNVAVNRLEQVHAFGRPDRDPRKRVISITYYTFVKADKVKVKAADDAQRARWFSVRRLPRLAFDHREILNFTLNVLRKEKRG